MALVTVKFWGVRGSIPAPGPSTVRFGGNTACLEVRAGEDLIILDMGSGLRPMGESLGRQPVKAAIFLSHYHWDHVQGLPFFGPAYNPASELDFYGPIREGRDVRAVLGGQMVAPYFPVTLEAFRARLSFHTIASGQTLSVGQTQVTARELNHPNGVLAYRIEREGKAVVYATDTEHGSDADQALVELAAGADTLIYDAMYTEDEYHGHGGRMPRTGWGHSTWIAGLKVAEKAGVRRFVLFHHEPTRSDDDLERLLADVRAVQPDALLAREGETLTL